LRLVFKPKLIIKGKAAAVRIQYFSDLHLEFGEFELPPPDAEVIVAAGDIGVGLDGFNWLIKQQRPVVYVAGNHEFYAHEYWDLLARLEQSAAGSKVHSFWSWDNRPSALTRLAYCNDLRELMYEHDIALWFHGHTHVVWDYRCAATRVLCNPRGYSGIKLVEGFRPDRVVVV
jgi:predicted phosphodiesterase